MEVKDTNGKKIIPNIYHVDEASEIPSTILEKLQVGDIVTAGYADKVGYVCRVDYNDTLEILQYDAENGYFIKHTYEWDNDENKWEWLHSTNQKRPLYLHEVSDGTCYFAFVSSNPNPIFDVNFSQEKIVAVRYLEDRNDGQVSLTFSNFGMIESGSHLTLRAVGDIYFSTSQYTTSIVSANDYGFEKAYLTEDITELE